MSDLIAHKKIGVNLVKFDTPYTDTISRQAAIDAMREETCMSCWDAKDILKHLPSVSTEKTGRCKDCKWWKDSDGVYRRGIRAESRCPINTVSVANGVGYCYMFKPKTQRVEE